MTTGVRCPHCDAGIPEGGRFCIECGRQIVQPATGATERLPDAEGGPRCEACGTRNPPGAQFCVMCGRALGPGSVATAEVAALDIPATPTTPAAPIAPTAPAFPPMPAPVPQPRNATMWGGISGGIFLIGLAVLALTGWWWPGILVLIGITALASSFVTGRPGMGLQGALWLFGIALIAQFNLWWPGILILAGLSAIFGAIWRPHR